MVTESPNGNVLHIDRGGKLALSAVIAEVLVSTFAPRAEPLPLAAKWTVAALAAVYLAFGLWPRVTRVTGIGPYLLASNALAVAIVWASHGHGELAPLPVLSLCVLVYARPIVFAVCLLHTASAALCVITFMGASHVYRFVGPFIAAEVFVIAFTQLALAERRARAELATAHRKLAEYATQAEELATIKERNRLARELHDSLGHYLTVIHVQLQAAASQLEHDRKRAQTALSTALRLVHEGLDDVRRSVAALRASPMDERSLPDAIRALTAELASSGTEIHIDVTGTPRTLSAPIELAFYRAAQEALTNVRKHARAARATIALEYSSRAVRLCVEDDGQGAIAPAGLGFGLLGVRERAALLGGKLELRTQPGFALTLTIADDAEPP